MKRMLHHGDADRVDWRWAMLVSAIASIALAVLIAAGWPRISLIALGILLGVNFLSSGLGYIFVSRGLKPLA